MGYQLSYAILGSVLLYKNYKRNVRRLVLEKEGKTETIKPATTIIERCFYRAYSKKKKPNDNNNNNNSESNRNNLNRNGRYQGSDDDNEDDVNARLIKNHV